MAYLNIVKIYRDFNVPFITEGHKHCQQGWVQVACPFCTGNPGWHLGFNLEGGFYSCWRCGGHPTEKAIQALTKENWKKVKQIIVEYSSGLKRRVQTNVDPYMERKNAVTLPNLGKELTNAEKAYLISRNFDPAKLEGVWDLRSGGIVGGYKFRVVAPIYFREKLVSYQARDITGRSELPYKACKQIDEVRDHKHCLYGLDMVPRETIVVVEGITDAWRLGPGAVSTFGIKYTAAQVLLLREFRRIFTFFDPDPQAREQQEKLSNMLDGGGREVIELSLEGDIDPAELSQDEATKLMLDLLK